MHCFPYDCGTLAQLLALQAAAEVCSLPAIAFLLSSLPTTSTSAVAMRGPHLRSVPGAWPVRLVETLARYAVVEPTAARRGPADVLPCVRARRKQLLKSLANWNRALFVTEALTDAFDSPCQFEKLGHRIKCWSRTT